MRKRRHELLRGTIDKQGAHERLTADDRKRILAVLPIASNDEEAHEAVLNRIARWIERYTLTGERAKAVRFNEPPKESVDRLEAAAKRYAHALDELHPQIKKRLYYALVSDEGGSSLTNREIFDRGRERYGRFEERALFIADSAKAVRQAARGQKTNPMFDFVLILADIWQSSTGLKFRASRNRRGDAPRRYVETVVELAEEIANRAGRTIWTPPRLQGKPETRLSTALKEARKELKKPQRKRSDREKYSDQNTGRS